MVGNAGYVRTVDTAGNPVYHHDGAPAGATTEPEDDMHRISMKQFLADEGYDNLHDYLEDNPDAMDAVCPALCEEGCQVEPDGRCEHGNPSLLIAAGLI